jgi:hypothetical protein
MYVCMYVCMYVQRLNVCAEGLLWLLPRSIFLLCSLHYWIQIIIFFKGKKWTDILKVFRWVSLAVTCFEVNVNHCDQIGRNFAIWEFFSQTKIKCFIRQIANIYDRWKQYIGKFLFSKVHFSLFWAHWASSFQKCPVTLNRQRQQCDQIGWHFAITPPQIHIKLDSILTHYLSNIEYWKLL